MKTLKEFLEAFQNESFKMKVSKSVLLTVIEFLVMKIMYWSLQIRNIKTV